MGRGWSRYGVVWRMFGVMGVVWGGDIVNMGVVLGVFVVDIGVVKGVVGVDIGIV